jgi:hypothetical protein
VLVPHGAIKAPLRRLVARSGEMNGAKFLIGIVLRDAWRRPKSKSCHACDGCYEQRFTHDLPLGYGQYAFAFFCLIALA